ncbi:biotin synthase BioB [Candidatus Acidulodesulfobacterium sp. H_13]|uniref:biotin synthase BioB n=1 Tax=Candidatus Acidulodesulfobacterium sp. H_13 TaxID=3395470 RepID=UPI003AF71838
MSSLTVRIKNLIDNGVELPDDILLSIYELSGSPVLELFSLALELKEKYTGKRVNFCSIVSAKTGICSEDCAFCGQSIIAGKEEKKTKINRLLSVSEIVKAAKIAKNNGANEFSIVTSGTSINDKNELEIIADAVKHIKEEVGIVPCASLGLMKYEHLLFLKNCGLAIFHHNIETSSNYFPKICSTHSFADNVETVKSAKRAGLKICSGVIIGMGESKHDRINMAKEIKELDADNIPVNFLNPIKGTLLENTDALTPMECLKTLAIFRLVNPKKNILAQGGREHNLRQLQPLALMAGANGLLLGNYLLTSGRNPELDIELTNDLGLEHAEYAE